MSGYGERPEINVREFAESQRNLLLYANHWPKKQTFQGGIEILDATNGIVNQFDYEIGTWTPVVADAVSGGNAGTHSGVAANNWYIKTGDIYQVHFSLIDIDTTGLTAGNVFYIQGIPATSSSVNTSATCSPNVRNMTLAGNYTIALISSSVSSILLRNIDGTGTFDNVLVSEITTGSADIFGLITYRV